MDDPGRCPRCLYRRELCLCPTLAALGPIVTRTQVVILRHHTERTRSSNTGRLAHLALPASTLIDIGAPDRVIVTPELGEGTWLVYPDGPARTIAPVPPPRALVFLDATWQQARRMRRRLPYLRGLPTLTLAPVPAAARLRNAPSPGQVSTIEAIATALRLVESDAVAEPLERLFATAVEHAQAAGRRSPAATG
ncbi:MAG: DTW domain-containing protein [Myxococcales bacterium]|nr:DTW domain-containing protein [Myxococcales bacterium]